MPLLDTSPGTIEQRLKLRRTPEQKALQVFIVAWNEQHGGWLSVSRDDDWAFNNTFIQVSTD